MSILTNILQLFKYDNTDKANNVNFNIETALNENWDKIDAAIALDRANWEQKADKVNITTTNAYQFINVPANTDFNTLTTKGVYTWLDTVGFTNAPSDIPRYGKMIVSDNVHNGSSCLQEIIGYNSTTKKVIKITRSKMNDTTYSWSSWSTEATTDKIDNLFEEGVWTPNLQGDTTVGTFVANSSNKGTYTRTNKTVTFTCWCRGTLSGATGNVILKGLPKTPKEIFTSVIGTSQKVSDGSKILAFCTTNAGSLLSLNIYKNDKSGLATSEINGQEILLCVSGIYEIA